MNEKDVISDLRSKLNKANKEIYRLHRVIANELTENDELGCEYTYVMVLKEEIEILRIALENPQLKSVQESKLIFELFSRVVKTMLSQQDGGAKDPG
jgi:uncharacterized coiled-coil DUF342 family protein